MWIKIEKRLGIIKTIINQYYWQNIVQWLRLTLKRHSYYKQYQSGSKMYEIGKNQHPNQVQKYYPACIKEAETQQNIKMLVSIMNKILNLPVRRNRIPVELLIKVSSFVFNNPIVLSYPLYQQIQQDVVCYGSYILYSRDSQTTYKVEIKKYWRKLERMDISMDGVMRLAVHFDDCLELKNNPIEQEGQNTDQKWRIVSQNNHYYQSLLKIMSKYKKDGIINEYVIKAFAQMMNHNILLIIVNSYQHYLIIDRTQPRQGKKIMKVKMDGNVKIGFSFEDNSIKMASKHFDVYTSTEKIEKRGGQTLLDYNNCCQIDLDDIYLR